MTRSSASVQATQAMQRIRTLGCASLLLAAAAVAPAMAQEWPNRPITIVVGYPAGGTNDTAARMLSVGLSERLGTSIVIDNRTGAGGSIAAQSVARAKPDGYTLYMMSSSQALAPALRKDLGWDPASSFDPIALVCSTPYALLVSPENKAASVKDLIAEVKASPGKFKYGSSGVGAGPHLTAERFRQLAAIDVQHIPYRGDTPVLTDLLGNQISMAFISVPTAKPFVDGGKLRALAVASPQRVAALKGSPTVEEGGGPKGFNASAWWGLVAPAGTPREILDKVEKATVATLASEQLRKQFDDSAFEVGSLTRESYRRYIVEQKAEFAEIVKAARITVDAP